MTGPFSLLGSTHLRKKLSFAIFDPDTSYNPTQMRRSGPRRSTIPDGRSRHRLNFNRKFIAFVTNTERQYDILDCFRAEAETSRPGTSVAREGS